MALARFEFTHIMYKDEQLYAIIDTEKSLYMILNIATPITSDTIFAELIHTLNEKFPSHDPIDRPPQPKPVSRNQKEEENLIKKILNGRLQETITSKQFKNKYLKD
jgi:hypothetical protein